MAKNRILVVDDEQGMLEVCADTLGKLASTEILLESQGACAAERIATESLDLIIADIRMPEIGGLDLLRMARQQDPNVAVLMLTAYPTIETAIECMKLGAADYIIKPFLPEDLLVLVQRLLEGKRAHDENRLLRRQIERSYTGGEILGKSPLMLRVLQEIDRVAQTDFDVLVIGETGTGKELVARSIHQRSRRRGGPFVPVDCGAIPEQLMESEFFGHERGAFTGAQTRSPGLLEIGHKGTFFLDEISQLPLRLQSKLLRVLQERRIRRVGGTKEIEIDLRIVAASSTALEEEVRRERFRLDLYHRVHVVRIELPPLRQRSEDIPLLAEHFLDRYSKETGRDGVTLSPEVLEVLAGYSWPGNVRELQNVLKRMLAFTQHDAIILDDLPDEIVARAGEATTKDTDGFFQLRDRRVVSFEKEYLRNLLTGCRGDVLSAARQARLPRGTLYRLLKKHELNPAEFRPDSTVIRGQEPEI